MSSHPKSPLTTSIMGLGPQDGIKWSRIEVTLKASTPPGGGGKRLYTLSCNNGPWKAQPRALRFLSFGSFYPLKPYHGQKLGIYEVQSTAPGARGAHGKDGLVATLRERGVVWHSFLTELNPASDDPTQAGAAPPPYPEGGPPPVHPAVLKTMGLTYAEELKSSRKVYFWADKLCILQGSGADARDDRAWHGLRLQRDVHAGAARRYVLPGGLSSPETRPDPDRDHRTHDRVAVPRGRTAVLYLDTLSSASGEAQLQPLRHRDVDDSSLEFVMGELRLGRAVYESVARLLPATREVADIEIGPPAYDEGESGSRSPGRESSMDGSMSYGGGDDLEDFDDEETLVGD